MKKIIPLTSLFKHLSSEMLVLFFLFAMLGCDKEIGPEALRDFNQVNLVANKSIYHAAHLDPVLENAWGLAWTPNGFAWVNAEEGHVSNIYDGEGNIIRPPVNIPSPTGPTGGMPSGIIFNGGGDFVLSNGQPARFVFVGTDGILSGWNGAAGNNALLIKNNSATSAYTGLTQGMNGTTHLLYAANFRTGSIDAWDKSFTPVSLPFKDPGLPAGFAPFNIQAVGSWLYVMYAKVGPDGKDLAGPGLGYVDIYRTDGTLVKRFASKGKINDPWGVTEAPIGFFTDKDGDEDDKGDNAGVAKTGKQAGDDQTVILVGNFGDGRVNAFSHDGHFLGQLKAHGHFISIPGLWALSFPPTTAASLDPNRLYFTAGPAEETDGIFGYIIKR